LASKKTVHAIREHLSIITLTLQHDLDPEPDRISHVLIEVEKINKLLNLMDVSVVCPMEGDCPLLSPTKKKKS
jgi:hypothetical protein